jgi:hypothetical protein
MYNRDMKSVLVRFPDDLYAALHAKAQAERRTVTAQILTCIEQCVTPPPTTNRTASGANLTADPGNDYTTDPKTSEP